MRMRPIDFPSNKRNIKNRQNSPETDELDTFRTIYAAPELSDFNCTRTYRFSLIRLGQSELPIASPMKLFNEGSHIQTLRPRVIEIAYGLFRGYVDIQEHHFGVSTTTSTRYCQTSGVSRDLAERQALALAKELNLSAKKAGVSTQLMDGSLGDALAGRQELDGIPAFLIRRDVAPRARTQKHLRAVA